MPGGTRRTIICPCGKVMMGNYKRLDTLQRLHNKVCPDGDSKVLYSSQYPVEFSSPNVNNWDGIQKTRNGNLSVQQNIKQIYFNTETLEKKVEEVPRKDKNAMNINFLKN